MYRAFDWLSPPGRSAGRLFAAVSLCHVLLVGAAAAGSKAVILNSNDDTMSIIDTAAYKEIARMRIGRAPHHLLATPDGKTLVVALAGGDEIALIDLATSKLKERIAISDPYQIGFSPDGKWFVSASLRLNQIDVYNPDGYRLVHRIVAETMPSHIGFAPDSSAAYVTLQGSNSLLALDLASGRRLWKALIGRQPAGVWVRPSGTVLVANMGSDHIAEADPRDGTVIRRVRTGRGAHNFLISPDGKTLYVTNRVGGTISIIDAETLEVTGEMKAAGGPDDSAWSVDGRELWVTGRWRGMVSVLDRTTGALKAVIPVGRSPHGIFVD